MYYKQLEKMKLLLPCMSRQQPDIIASPVTSLLVRRVDCDSSTDQSPDNFVFGWIQVSVVMPDYKDQNSFILVSSCPSRHGAGS